MVKTFCVTYKLQYVLHLVLERKTVHIAPKFSGQGSPTACHQSYYLCITTFCLLSLLFVFNLNL